MALNFGRAKGSAEVLIDSGLCSKCGACVEVCKGGPLVLEENGVTVHQDNWFGCIGCGACIAVCPQNAIRISGRDLFPEDILPLEPLASRSDYASLQQLFLSRRSTRNFKDREIEPELIQQILDAAATSPMGLPPSEVGLLVFAGYPAVKEIRDDLLRALPVLTRYFTPFTMTLARPFMSTETYEMYRGFMLPALKIFVEKAAEGEDWFLYNPPLALYFYGNALNDPGDPIIAAACAMFAAESLGLGTCMLGFPPYLFQYSAKLRRRYNLPSRIQPGIMLVCGYRQFQPLRAIRRRFGRVKTIQG